MAIRRTLRRKMKLCVWSLRGEESWVIGASGLFQFGEAGSISDGLPASLEISSWIEEELRDMVGVTAKRD